MKKKIFMLKKLWTDIRTESPPLYDGDLTSKQLSYYYINFGTDTKKLNKLIAAFDEEGVPLNSSYIDVEDDGLHYYPISIGQYGLSVYHNYLRTKEETLRAQFIRIADWFVSNAIKDQKLGAYWLTEVPKPEFNVHLPWKSAFTQSRALSILSRAWQLTGELKYRSLLIEALSPFRYDVKEGGVSVDRAIGMTWYEEYIAVAPTRILDGGMFSLFGLLDAKRALRDSEEADVAAKLFNEGVDGLVKWLPRFDMGYWVYYNRCDLPEYPQNDPCTIGYLRLVVGQLDILHRVTGRKELLEYKHLWMSYLRPINVLRMYKHKFIALRKLNRL